MKFSSNLFIFASFVLVLVFQKAYLDAAAVINEKSAMIESSGSDENNASLRDKKEANGLAAIEQNMPVPVRRHHLKFGVLGKRYAYGYLGKRTEVPESEDDFQNWLNDMRERRGGRPQYGLLG
ncbi:hypothetical protein I4U23_006938 [Adineta vaga]|nr:hypothetical protein I4U23_006938 [Adineta vaga]